MQSISRCLPSAPTVVISPQLNLVRWAVSLTCWLFQSSPGDPTVAMPCPRFGGWVPTANSRDVAAYFRKEHRNVLQAIDRLECSPEFTALNFQRSDRNDATGRMLRSFDMTKRKASQSMLRGGGGIRRRLPDLRLHGSGV